VPTVQCHIYSEAGRYPLAIKLDQTTGTPTSQAQFATRVTASSVTLPTDSTRLGIQTGGWSRPTRLRPDCSYQRKTNALYQSDGAEKSLR
jgi:hypothetical protein